MASELETNVVAVERIREYTDLPTEVGRLSCITNKIDILYLIMEV